MKLKNIVIVVKDVERSKQFYKELFGLDVILDQEGNVILTEGLVLQKLRCGSRRSGKTLSGKIMLQNFTLKRQTLICFWKSFNSMSRKFSMFICRKKEKARSVQLGSMILTEI